jgi:hypothetical protein
VCEVRTLLVVAGGAVRTGRLLYFPAVRRQHPRWDCEQEAAADVPHRRGREPSSTRCCTCTARSRPTRSGAATGGRRLVGALVREGLIDPARPTPAVRQSGWPASNTVSLSTSLNDLVGSGSGIS